MTRSAKEISVGSYPVHVSTAQSKIDRIGLQSRLGPSSHPATDFPIACDIGLAFSNRGAPQMSDVPGRAKEDASPHPMIYLDQRASGRFWRHTSMRWMLRSPLFSLERRARNDAASKNPNVRIFNLRIDPPRWRQVPRREGWRNPRLKPKVLLKSESSHLFGCGTPVRCCFAAFSGG